MRFWDRVESVGWLSTTNQPQLPLLAGDSSRQTGEMSCGQRGGIAPTSNSWRDLVLSKALLPLSAERATIHGT